MDGDDTEKKLREILDRFTAEVTRIENEYEAEVEKTLKRIDERKITDLKKQLGIQ